MTEYDEIKYANLSDAALPEIQNLQELAHRDQFLMKLRPEYETIRSGLMSRIPPPSLYECLRALLREEQRQLTQAVLSQQANGPLEATYVARNSSPASVQSTGDKGKYPQRDMSIA